MSINIIVPPLGESVKEATVARWHKKSGDIVVTDELLVELETDKVTLEVNAPASGKLSEIKVAEGNSVGVGAVLGAIEERKGTASSGSLDKKNEILPLAKSAEKNKEITASPAAYKIAADAGINVAKVPGTGKDNRVTKGDVLGAMGSVPVTGGVIPEKVRHEQRVKMTRLRKTIAERLKASQNTAAILTTFNEVDMSEVFTIRKNYQEQFQEKHGIKLGFMSFFVKAVVQALKEIPAINAEIEGDDIIYKNYYDIGIAVGTEQGLVVPVLRDADKLSFSEIEKSIAILGKKARDGKLTMSDMSGATFSITNGGIYGSLLSTPIINPPQSGILGMHNIVERPVAINGEVRVKPMMYIALSYDHRIVDGKEAVTFLIRVKQMVEKPEKMLFDL